MENWTSCQEGQAIPGYDDSEFGTDGDVGQRVPLPKVALVDQALEVVGSFEMERFARSSKQ